MGGQVTGLCPSLSSRILGDPGFFQNGAPGVLLASARNTSSLSPELVQGPQCGCGSVTLSPMGSWHLWTAGPLCIQSGEDGVPPPRAVQGSSVPRAGVHPAFVWSRSGHRQVSSVCPARFGLFRMVTGLETWGQRRTPEPGPHGGRSTKIGVPAWRAGRAGKRAGLRGWGDPCRMLALGSVPWFTLPLIRERKREIPDVLTLQGRAKGLTRKRASAP